jgi:hypothetical protein
VPTAQCQCNSAVLYVCAVIKLGLRLGQGQRATAMHAARYGWATQRAAAWRPRRTVARYEHAGPLCAYEQHVNSGSIRKDPVQLRALQHLQHVRCLLAVCALCCVDDSRSFTHCPGSSTTSCAATSSSPLSLLPCPPGLTRSSESMRNPNPHLLSQAKYPKEYTCTAELALARRS